MEKSDDFELKELQNKDVYEPVAPNVAKLEGEAKFLKLSGLRKVFENGFEAVKGLNFKMYQG